MITVRPGTNEDFDIIIALMDEAVAWLKKAPFDGGTEIELRPVFETADFGAEMTPELREQEDRLRATVEARKA